MQRTVNPSPKGYAGSNPARRTKYRYMKGILQNKTNKVSSLLFLIVLFLALLSPQNLFSETLYVEHTYESFDGVKISAVTNAQEEERSIVEDLGEGALTSECSFGETANDFKKNSIPDCDIEHIFQLVEKIIRVLIWIAVFGVVIAFVWHGVILALNQFFPGEYAARSKQAKKSFIMAIIGLFIVLAAWAIVKFFIVDLFSYKYDPFNYQDQIDKVEIDS